MSERVPPVEFFSDGSPYLSHPLLTAERTAAEIDEIERLVGPVSGRVLDVGCGFGRHSIELASLNADVTGIDPSAAMIAAARTAAADAKQLVDFICIAAQDFREVARYDVALCLFTTLGQLGHVDRRDGDEAGHLGLLRQVTQALRPGGDLVIELPDRDRMVNALVEREQLGPTLVTRSFDSRKSIMTERFDLETGEAYVLRYRLFEATELVDMVHDAGLEVRQVLDTGLVQPPMTMTTLVAKRSA